MPSLTGDEQRLVQAIGECQDELLTLAGDLIKIPSENPPGDCTEVATWIHDYLRGQGIDPDDWAAANQSGAMGDLTALNAIFAKVVSEGRESA